MNKVRLSDVNEEVRSFLQQALTPGERWQAQVELERLWKTTGPAMRELGVTEADIDRDLQEDD
jgi:hypothetical protein